MRERYESKELESVVNQITNQLEQVVNDPSLLAKAPNMTFLNAAKHVLVGKYGFSEDEALDHAAKMKVDLNDSGLDDFDIVKAAHDLVDATMRLLDVIHENYGESMYKAMLKHAFHNVSLSYG